MQEFLFENNPDGKIPHMSCTVLFVRPLMNSYSIVLGVVMDLLEGEKSANFFLKKLLMGRTIQIY